MKMKYVAVALATCLVALLLTISIGATDVTVAETTAETTAETIVETDAGTTGETSTETNEVSEDTEGEKSGMGFRPETLKNTLPIMGMGMLGIFLVTGVIVLVIMLLNKISNAVEARKGGEDVE